MLHSLHVPVDRVFIDTENPEKLGQELVTVNDCFCDLLSLGGQDRAAILLVLYEPLGVQSLEHLGDAGLGNAQALGDVNRSGIALLFYEVQDLFQVVVHCDTTTGSGGMRTHLERVAGYFGSRTEFPHKSWN